VRDPVCNRTNKLHQFLLELVVDGDASNVEQSSKVTAGSIRSTRRLLLLYYMITIHLDVIYLLADKLVTNYEVVPAEQARQLPEPSPLPSEVTQSPTPAGQPTGSPAAVAPMPEIPRPNAAGLIIPVAGVKPGQLTDSFKDARSEGRVHDAIDIPAAAGTPVIAVADGTIAKLFDSQAGGITIYQLSADKRFVYYYAHLSGRAPDIKVGNTVAQGKVIGYVGDTGNAGAGNYHLHFSIAEVTDPKRYWEGTYIDPYPLLAR
jgi:peptidoglycan LD-endopeptidase LytH